MVYIPPTERDAHPSRLPDFGGGGGFFTSDKTEKDSCRSGFMYEGGMGMVHVHQIDYDCNRIPLFNCLGFPFPHKI